MLIVGLGNPGREYERHRHNVGAMAVDAIHRTHRFGPWRRRFSADIAEGTLADAKVLLLKPLTYMNESGRAVGEAARFHKVELGDIIVLHDELDLPAGKLRVKTGGGGAGHNGIRSVTGHLGADYRRVRIGIGHPGHRDLVTSYVLRDFPKGDAEWLDPLLAAIAENAPLLVAGKDAEFGNRVHRATAVNAEPDSEQRDGSGNAVGGRPASAPRPRAKATGSASGGPSKSTTGPSIAAPTARSEAADSAAAPPAEPGDTAASSRGPFGALKRLLGGKPRP